MSGSSPRTPGTPAAPAPSRPPARRDRPPTDPSGPAPAGASGPSCAAGTRPASSRPRPCSPALVPAPPNHNLHNGTSKQPRSWNLPVGCGAGRLLADLFDQPGANGETRTLTGVTPQEPEGSSGDLASRTSIGCSVTERQGTSEEGTFRDTVSRKTAVLDALLGAVDEWRRTGDAELLRSSLSMIVAGLRPPPDRD